MNQRLLFRSVWWLCNISLVTAIAATIGAGVWEFSTREYLKGFSDAIVSERAGPTQKAQAILDRPEYTYDRFVQVRLGALPFRGGQIR